MFLYSKLKYLPPSLLSPRFIQFALAQLSRKIPFTPNVVKPCFIPWLLDKQYHNMHNDTNYSDQFLFQVMVLEYNKA